MAHAGAEWLPVVDAASRLGISTKTLRKRMASGAVRSRRVVLARGGAAYEVEVLPGLEPSNSTSKASGARVFPTLRSDGLGVESESSKPGNTEVDFLRDALAQERQNAAFLRGVIEQLQRDGAETRAALRKALENAPKQLTAGESSTNDATAQESAPETRDLDPLDLPEGVSIFAALADDIERKLNR